MRMFAFGVPEPRNWDTARETKTGDEDFDERGRGPTCWRRTGRNWLSAPRMTNPGSERLTAKGAEVAGGRSIVEFASRLTRSPSRSKGLRAR